MSNNNYGARTVRELTWDCLDALPPWLQLTGSGASLSFSDQSVSRGVARLSTGGGSGATAGLRLAKNIDPSHFYEIGMYVYSAQLDASATGNNSRTRLFFGDNTTVGARIESLGLDNTVAQVFPAAAESIWYDLGRNAPRRKGVGISIIPERKEVQFTSGDPNDRSGSMVWRSQGSWENTVSAFEFAITATTPAFRYVDIAKIKLRLVSW